MNTTGLRIYGRMNIIEFIRRNFILNSPFSKKLFETLKKFSLYRKPLLFLGESGSGKRTFAYIYHLLLWEKKEGFFYINGSNLSSEVSYADLFGYRKGAFSGADEDFKGKIHRANNGTLYISNIEYLSKEIYPELLRAINSKEYYRLGDNRAESFKGILLFSSSKGREELKEYLPEEFYFTLKPYIVEVLPLRERKEDIKPFVRQILKELNRKENKNKYLSNEAYSYLKSINLSGNFRVLKNMVEFAFYNSGERKRIIIEDFPQESFSAEEIIMKAENELLTLDELIREYFFRVYKLAGGNKRKIAKILGITERSVYNYIKRYGIENGEN